MMLYSVLFVLTAIAVTVLLWPMRDKKRACIIIGLGFFISAFALYQWVGTPQILPLLKARKERIAELKETILKNSEAVKANPDNLAAWVELGQNFMETSQWDAAANAFKRAVVLSEGSPKLILAYAKALILNDDGTVSDDARKSLEMVLLQEPDNADARYFLAVRKLQDGKTEEAMKDMQSLYKALPADSPLKQMIDQQIGKKTS